MSKVMKAQKSKKKRECSVVSESGEVCWEELMRKYSESQRKTCKSMHVTIPKVERSMKEFPTGSKYEGSWNVLGLSGKGTYHFPHGVVYKGDFLDGEFHGDGELQYESGAILRGKFDRGVMTERTLSFGDGLLYSETGWKYCKQPDRRFTVEYELGLQAAGESFMTSEPATQVTVPPGLYDTGDGFYDPKTNIIYSYHDLTNIVRSPSAPECEWIVKKCRTNDNPSPVVGPCPSLYEKWVQPELELETSPQPASNSEGLFRTGDSEEDFDFEAYEDPSYRFCERRSTITKGKPRMFYKVPEKCTIVGFCQTDLK